MSSTTQSPPELPPEAIALASRFFDGARTGQEDLLAQGLARGIPPNMMNDRGDTLLMLAAYHGHASLVSLLLRHGADPNRINDRGQSILAGVVFKNEEQCVKLLLEAGADPEIGTPSALDATRVFKQEQYERLFLAQIKKLKEAKGGAVNGDSTGLVNGHGEGGAS
ncbi:putative ankyrin repeat protein [Cyphellophora attinorum]|uniref:Putative ankyrin repeat protein n=1 Tax=Cyphellophora attinorum TaxID=1664694 RepID=A0A0N0NM09_9EURO|nr:putative ankyrin repeat protein [Phialophora attinorum]KPI39659.1 putative ankyrin repeat protein [Phialophora attinorum]